MIAELGTRLVLRLPPGRVLVDLARSHPEPVGASSVDVRTKARLQDSVYRIRRTVGGGLARF